MYTNSINYFRGISIILIVFGHCLGLADFSYNSILGNTIYNLTIGGTSFFVFISGFLFHHIFYPKFQFKRFLINKTKYVLLPYLILSTLPIAYLLLRICISAIPSSSSITIRYNAMSSFPIFRHYLTGVDKSFIGYWYIPFIIIIFLLSPLFVRFIKLNFKTQILITILLLICSIFMHRGIDLDAFSVFQNVLYFTPIYLFGIISSEIKDVIYSKLKGKEFYLLSIAFTLAIFQAYIGKLGNYHKLPFIYGGMDLMILQKISLCLFFMVYLKRFENYKLRFFEVIATNSFGIFFIHGIVIFIIRLIKEKLDFSFAPNSFIIYFLVASIVFFLSLIVTLIVKRIFPKHSRYLIGS
jgi:surface polysaccharide O-acyltransferase-like enzyme